MKIFALILSLVVGMFVFSPNVTMSDEKKTREVFEAFVTPTGGGAPGQAVPVEIVITEWTTDEEKDQYMTILKTDGQDALMKTIKKNNKGYCRIGRNTGQQLLAARSVQTPEGNRKITAIYGSVTGNFQVRANSKSGDFPFALVELIMKPDGQGDGMIAAAVGVTVKPDGSLDLENFGAYPGKLMSLHQQK